MKMRPNEGPSRLHGKEQEPLLNSENELSQELSEDSRVVVNVRSLSSEEKETQVVSSMKYRPLNLADDYEVVGGIPAFVWREPRGDAWGGFYLYAFSLDGTRMLLRKGLRQIWLYDVTDSFKPLANLETKSRRWIECLAFWKDRNDMFLVCHDHRAAFYHFRHNSTSEQGDNVAVRKLYGRLELLSEKSYFRDLKYEQVCLKMTSSMSATSICEWKVNSTNKIKVYYFDNEHQQPKYVEVVPDRVIKKPDVHIASNGRSLMVVDMHSSTAKRNTFIYSGIISSGSPKEKLEIVMNGFGLCWSSNGEFFAMWSIDDERTSFIQVYSTTTKTRSRRLFSKEIGYDIVAVQAMFVENQTSTSKTNIDKDKRDIPLIAFLKRQSKKAFFALWNWVLDKPVSEIDLVIGKMDLTSESEIVFCISQNQKWMAVGYLKNKVVGLFSLLMGKIVWSIKLSFPSSINQNFVPLQFDPMSSKLIVKSKEKLYAFAPTCLLEDHKIDFKCSNYYLSLKCAHSFLKLKEKHQQLTTKVVLWKLLEFTCNAFQMTTVVQKLDIASSIISSKICLLLKDDKGLIIFCGLLESVFSSWHKMISLQKTDEYEMGEDTIKIRISANYSEECYLENNLSNHHIFLYPNLQDEKESIVVLCIKDRKIIGLFASPNGEIQYLMTFSQEDHWHTNVSQSTNGQYLYILGSDKVMIIDLNQKNAKNVQYGIDLKNWFTQDIHEKELKQYDISLDGKVILIGWNIKKNERVVLTSTTTQDELVETKAQANAIIDCWSLSNDFETSAFIKCANIDKSILSISIHNNKNQKLKEYKKEHFNQHVNRVLKNISKNSIITLMLDQSRGSIWIIALLDKGEKDSELIWIPIGPYSMEECIPSLWMRDYPAKKLGNDELNELISKFGISVLNMSFNKKTNFRISVDNQDEGLMLELVNYASKDSFSKAILWNQGQDENSAGGFMKSLLLEKNEETFKFFINLIEKKALSFEDSASMMKECFNELWMQYHALMEPILNGDTLTWDFGIIDIHLDIINHDKYAQTLVGTTNSLDEWRSAKKNRILEQKWRKSNEDLIEEIEKKCSPTKTKASLKFFCVEDCCKIGSNGILRYLLIQDAPSYFYKTEMVTAVVNWKWKSTWKRHCQTNLVLYTTFSIAFSIYAISIISVIKHHRSVFAKVILSIILAILVVFAGWSLIKECIQLYTYVMEGKNISSSRSRRWGLKHYFLSMWNNIELITYILLLVVIPVSHILCLITSELSTLFIIVLSFETLMIWIKFWYFAQAFKGFGALVLMIENIVKDCAYFLVLTVLLLVGFSLALFIILHSCTHSEEDSPDEAQPREYKALASREDEEADDGSASFSAPYKAVLTMFYAMVGTFDPEIYETCGDWTFSITLLFVAYVAIQLIVMLNMLIAIMGDTFDRVKETEDEQLLLGRARFIDACEASILPKQKERIEEKTGKYLYIVLPLRESENPEEMAWKGRVRTLDEKTKHRLIKFQQEITKRMDAIESNMKQHQEVVEERIAQIDKNLTAAVQSNHNEMKQTIGDLVKSVDELKQR